MQKIWWHSIVSKCTENVKFENSRNQLKKESELVLYFWKAILMQLKQCDSIKADIVSFHKICPFLVCVNTIHFFPPFFKTICTQTKIMYLSILMKGWAISLAKNNTIKQKPSDGHQHLNYLHATQSNKAQVVLL